MSPCTPQPDGCPVRRKQNSPHVSPVLLFLLLLFLFLFLLLLLLLLSFLFFLFLFFLFFFFLKTIILPRQARNTNAQETLCKQQNSFFPQARIAPGMMLLDPGVTSAQASKRHFLSHLYIKCITLPRQARDKHRENSKNDRFLAAMAPRRPACADEIQPGVGRTCSGEYI
eukprot:COSAG06_NODE_2459_length_6837_cov_11.462897_2_plen_170_part_00